MSVGCSKQDSAKPAASQAEGSGASSGNPLTAPVDYLGAMGKAQKSASKTVSAAGLDQAVKLFYAQEGRFPKDLVAPDRGGAAMATTPHTRASFVIPGDLATPSGGYGYDRRILARLPAYGIDIAHVALPGSFPNPTPVSTTIGPSG